MPKTFLKSFKKVIICLQGPREEYDQSKYQEGERLCQKQRIP